MRRLAAAFGILLAPMLAVGCGSSDGGATPTACLGGPSRYLSALRAAPAEVRLGGDTAISDCFSDAQASGEFANVGQTVIRVATALNAKARRDPAGEAGVELGYLDGAVRKGISDNAGSSVDLMRRVESAARFNPGGGSPGAAFERSFGRGYAAGENSG